MDALALMCASLIQTELHGIRRNLHIRGHRYTFAFVQFGTFVIIMHAFREWQVVEPVGTAAQHIRQGATRKYISDQYKEINLS